MVAGINFKTIFNKLLNTLISKNSCKFLKIKILSISKEIRDFLISV